MCITQWIEIIIIAIAMLIVPFVLWIVHQLRESILSHVNLILNEYYSGLENQIKFNREEVNKMKIRLIHRTEISSIYYNSIVAKIEEIENYLEKSNGYRKRSALRRVNPVDVNLSTIPDRDDDDDLSMAF